MLNSKKVGTEKKSKASKSKNTFIINAMKRLDRFGQSLPGFNLEGNATVTSNLGGFCTILVFCVVLLYGII